MNPRIETLSLALASALPISLAVSAHAASVTYDADLGSTGAQDGSGLGWNTTDANLWDGATNVLWPNTTADEVIFGANNGAAGPVTVGAVNANKITFATPGSGNYALTGGTITLGGTTPTITANADASIGSALVGTVGLTKTGTGTLTLEGTNTYTGATSITAGTVTYGTGSSFNPAATGNLTVGGATGRAVLNLNNTGTFRFGRVRIGGDDGATNTGKGAIYQSNGTVTHTAGYFGLGVGTGASAALTDTYGYYQLSGGSLNSQGGTRIGDGGRGVFHQTGGGFTGGGHFVVGASEGSPSNGIGEATFSGGSANLTTTNSAIIFGDRQFNKATMNIGTQAGGSATVTAVTTHATGFRLLGNAGALAATVNLNQGTLVLGMPIHRNGTTVGSTATVNLNGGTLKANGNVALLNGDNGLVANVYNGGLKVDTQTNNATISANLLVTAGNGIYPAGGILPLTMPDGAGYIGAPQVAVSGGTGTGASAIANVANGQVTGITLTCPGQGYAEGDTVTFTFAGGGATVAAVPFSHVLTAGDLAANGAGGLTKLGTGRLTLTGTNSFTGPLSITGTLASNNLSLASTTLAIHNFAPTAPDAPLVAVNSLTTGGIVQVQIDGTFSPGSWPLIYYPVGGSIGGAGFSALQLQTGTLPRGVVATLVNNTSTSSVDLNVTDFNPLTWKGNTNAVWDIDTTTNWTIGAAAQKYLENDLVRFNDSATGSTSVTLNTVVAPQGVTFENDSKNYTLSGSGSITGIGGLTKSNNGTVTLLTDNTYTGSTTVDGGTLRLGDGTTNGSIAGALINNANVVFHPAGTASFTGALGGGSGGTFRKEGPGTLVVTSSSNTSTGLFQIDEGTLQFGNGTVNGATGTAGYDIASGASLRLDQATATALPSAGIGGAGNVFLNSAQAINGSASWGALVLLDTYTGTLRVEKGRVDTNPGSTALGNAAKVEILAGAQFLAFTSATPYATPIEIAGNGWGEGGYPGALRLAGDRTATWAGSVTLTADSGIMTQRNSNFTVTGPITGAFQCEFYAGDPVADSGNLIVAPAVPGQNTYASTKINGRPNGAIIAGSAQAFSTGPLVVDNAILKLNGHDLSFANLSGAGGAIGNYHATTPATITVGTDNTSTSYNGVLRDGGVVPLALVKTGTGTLTLNGSNSYTGNTSVAEGKLALVSPSLANGSTVTIASGAVIELNTGTSDIVGTLVLGNDTVPTGTYSASHLVYGSYFAGTGSLVVGGAFDSWAASKGLDGSPGKENGPTDDPEKDGIDNQTEFYLDGNPLASDPAILPAESLDASYLTLTFQRRDDAETAVTTQAIQHGDNLEAWITTALGTETATAPNGVIVTVEENDAAADDITVQIPRNAATKLFARLQVIK